MKKAFTVLELIISLTIFMILVLFMYKTLDNTKLSNKKLKSKVDYKIEVNSLYKIFAEDIAEMLNLHILKYDDEERVMLSFESNNSFNSPYYSNITYMINSKGQLVRIESAEKFLFEKADSEFYENTYIDVLVDDVESFDILQSTSSSFVFFIKQKNKKRVNFTFFKLKD